jgi:vesicular inhibitory amino acid transporter
MDLKSSPLLLSSGLNVGQVEKMELEQAAAKHGLSVITAALFLAGEMAGSGVLALPGAMVGTGRFLMYCLYLINPY